MIQQIEELLPRSEWEKVKIIENNEPLVELQETEKLKLATGIKRYDPSFHVRRSVANRLMKVSKKFPEYIQLVVIEGYRSLIYQQQEWDDMFKRLKAWYPDHPNDLITSITNRYVARPHPNANHFSGGAVDVTLQYGNGELFDMGTPYISQLYDKEIVKKIPMLSPYITPQQKLNRFILRKMMAEAGFVWYPEEWWHFCYGDRMWAVYTNKTSCFYGPKTIN